MGSKRRISKHILEIMLKDRKPGQLWVEPFVGGGNLIDKVDGQRLGADINPFTIQALKLIRDNTAALPKSNKEFTEQDYKAIRKDPCHPLHGYAGYAFSYGGRFFNGWSRSKTNWDYVATAYRSALKQSPKLQGVELLVSNYFDLVIPEKSFIYCDPPYKGTTKYKNAFDHDVFFDWCREQVKKGHTVYVSEYEAPSDFKCLWSKSISSSLTPNKSYKKNGLEKLFKLGD